MKVINQSLSEKVGRTPDGGFGSSVTFGLLFIYIVSIPLRFEIMWLHVHIQLMLFVTIALRVLAGFNRIVLTRTQIAAFSVLALTLMATVLGIPIAPSGENLRWMPVVTRFLVIPIACVLELNSIERMNRSLRAVMVAAAIVSILSIVNLFVTLPFAFTGQIRSLIPGTNGIHRTLGIAMGFGNFGVFAIIGASYAVMSVFRPVAIHGSERSRYTRPISMVSLALILSGVYLAQSRSTVLAFLLTAIWGIVISMIHPDSRLRSDIPVLPGTILLLIAVSGSVGSILFMDTILGVNTSSISSRVKQYMFALELMAERPLFGWGWRFSVEAIGTEIHNLWLRIGHSLGVPLFMLWVYLFGKLGLEMHRQISGTQLQFQTYNIIGVAMLLGASVELVLYSGFFPVTAVLLGILISIVGLRWTVTCGRINQ